MNKIIYIQEPFSIAMLNNQMVEPFNKQWLQSKKKMQKGSKHAKESGKLDWCEQGTALKIVSTSQGKQSFVSPMYGIPSGKLT